MFFVNFCFSQKKYSFNLISVYEIETDKNFSNQIIFTDTIHNSYKFRLIQKNNNFFPNLYNIETREYLYFETIKKNELSEINFLEDLKFSYSNQLPKFPNQVNKKICNLYKYYDRTSEKINDSTEIETFKFYKKKKKKKINYLVIIEYLNSNLLNSNSSFPSDFVYIIDNCKLKKNDRKIIKNVNVKKFENNKLISEENIRLLNTYTTDFTINLLK
jgi:hypothetical protein